MVCYVTYDLSCIYTKYEIYIMSWNPSNRFETFCIPYVKYDACILYQAYILKTIREKIVNIVYSKRKLLHCN